MRIVLDTNVLIAALIARGVCHELLEHCALRHTVLTSEFIPNEVAEKLVGKFGYSEEIIHFSDKHFPFEVGDCDYIKS